MSAELFSWQMVEPGQPLVLNRRPLPSPADHEVLLKVRACGLCHTDVAFLYGGVRPNADLPLTLGHEIVGKVVAAGDSHSDMLGRDYVVPAVLPCGDCDLCDCGRGNVCRSQKMPGNDFPGGFASHFLTPAQFLCPLPDTATSIEDYSVVADAVSTAYQAVVRAEVEAQDLVVVVGAGGVGTFAAQVAKHLAAHVVAIDIDDSRLDALSDYLDLPLNSSNLDARAVRTAITDYQREHGLASHRRKILECSGSAAGQQTAWSLLTHNAKLMVVGFTMDKTPLRLSNLMAFDATAQGNWGCLPEHYPAILDLVAQGSLALSPFVEHRPMSELNQLLQQEHHTRRPVLIPDF